VLAAPSLTRFLFAGRDPVTAVSRIRLRQAERHAEGYLELGLGQHALDALARVGEAAGRSARALRLKGEALRILERYDEALEPLGRAKAIEPDNVGVWLALGWCYKRTARIDRAVEALERASRVAPSDALVHYNLACYRSLAGDTPRALACLAQAIALDSRYRELVHEEPDFDPIRSDPEFIALTSIVV